VFLNCELMAQGKPIASNQLFFRPFGGLSLGVPQFETSIHHGHNGLKVTLVSNKFAKSVWLSVSENEGQFSDNYFDLLANQPKEITFRSINDIESGEFQRSLRIRSLADAFRN